MEFGTANQSALLQGSVATYATLKFVYDIKSWAQSYKELFL